MPTHVWHGVSSSCRTNVANVLTRAESMSCASNNKIAVAQAGRVFSWRLAAAFTAARPAAIFGGVAETG
jgi:hypothetical protein